MTDVQDKPQDEPLEDEESAAPAYGLNDEIVQEIQDAIEREDAAFIHEQLEDWYSADTADLIEQLKPKLRLPFLQIMAGRLDPDVYSDLDENVRDHLVDDMDAAEIAAFVNELEIDDAVDVLEDLEEDEQRDVLREIPADDRAALQEGLSYGEDSAGRLMQRNLIAVPEYWNIGQTIDYLRDTDDLPDEFYEIFVVDPRHHPIGTIPLNHAMRSKRQVAVRDIMDEEQKLIPVDMDQEDVAYLFQQYRLTSAAVVNADGALIGVITVDDIVDVISEEAEEDILRLGGVSEDDLFGSIWSTSRSRFLWLFVNLLTAIAASVAISFFDATMEAIIALAVLMPIVASMGGNAGTQTMTVAVRALATKELTAANMFRILSKETVVALLNGVVFAVLIGAIAWVWFESSQIGMIIATAMVFNILIAGIAGMLVPVTLDRMNIDPAIASSVFVTTVTDIVGFVAFLGLATFVLL
ncbi:magnesium transporter [uncultured Sneathiella sp.]|jgi:magnesium transporter|uniref:magnesium transporter n=1 Tax=uncultured Sneathiella sp. TaxID=879315 RepID=UPI0030D91972|tara:strand:- start:2701 stop:4104 length:1404 start_codon:yes stop_codon:yes gene_type:complete